MSDTEARARLIELFPRESTCYVFTTHVSSSGMTRWIKVLAIHDDEIWDVSYLVGQALGWPVNNRGHSGVRVRGAGMDMHFHLIYTLSQALYGAHHGYDLTMRAL